MVMNPIRAMVSDMCLRQKSSGKYTSSLENQRRYDSDQKQREGNYATFSSSLCPKKPWIIWMKGVWMTIPEVPLWGFVPWQTQILQSPQNGFLDWIEHAYNTPQCHRLECSKWKSVISNGNLSMWRKNVAFAKTLDSTRLGDAVFNTAPVRKMTLASFRTSDWSKVW